MGQEGCEQFLIQAAQEADVILIEGVMGLFDGMPSSADLARAFGIPVLVVISTQTMAQTAGTVALGLRGQPRRQSHACTNDCCIVA